jgi:hypothetical protein
VRRRPVGRGAAVGALVSLAVLALAGPAGAQDRDDEKNPLVVLTGRADVPEGQSFDALVIFDGPATVGGTVDGSVVAFNGPVTVSGQVQDDVVSFNGLVTIESGATVGGDVVSRRGAEIADGATVEGDVRRNAFEAFQEPFPFLARFLVWVAVSVSLLILGLLLLLLAPRAGDAVANAWRTGTGPAVGWGLILLLGLPLLGALAAITVVGIPFAIGLLFALGLLYSIAYVAGSLVLGRLIVKPPRSALLAFLVGLVIVRLLALIPVVAGIVGAIAAVIGFGAIAVATWRARRPIEPATPPAPATA